MKDIKEPQVTLSQEDIHYPYKPIEVQNFMIKDPVVGQTNFYHEEIEAIKDIARNFECLICKGIPI